MKTGTRRWLMLIGLGTAVGLPVAADDQRDALGYNDLVNRLGANTPDGGSVIAGQIEAAGGNGYAPDTGNSHFVGKTLNLLSGASGGSNHATAVAQHYYGSVFGIAPGINTINCWEANHWLQTGFLRLGQGSTPPRLTNSDVLNNSWIGTGGGIDREILRRLDFAIDDQSLVVTAGMGNAAGGLTNNDILLSHSFNSISVGRSDGNHHRGNTLSAVDGPGRMKPEIVAPDSATSWTTGLVSGVISLLRDTSRTTTGLSNNPNADRPDVIKAALLGGATHRPGWTNNPDPSGPNRGVTTRPLDPIFGVDQANVNTSHFILTGFEQDGSTNVPLSGSHTSSGWDLAPIDANSSVYYRFEIASAKDIVSMLVTWNRRVASNFGSWAMPDLNLELHRVDGGGSLLSLRGDPGLAVFAGGNIASISAVDNIEHLFIQNLEPGNYVLELSRASDGLGTWEAAVAWFMPRDASAPATLTDVTKTLGIFVSGGLSDLVASDDSYYVLQSGPGFNPAEPHPARMDCGFDTGGMIPSALDVTVEQHSNIGGPTAVVLLRNWATGQWDEIAREALTPIDQTFIFPGVAAGDYVNGSSRLEVRVRSFAVLVLNPNIRGVFSHDFVGVQMQQ